VWAAGEEGNQQLNKIKLWSLLLYLSLTRCGQLGEERNQQLKECVTKTPFGSV